MEINGSEVWLESMGRRNTCVTPQRLSNATVKVGLKIAISNVSY